MQGSALVLRYLARYVHRVAISDRRVQSITADRVTFSYKDAERQQWRTMTVPGIEFLQRFLQHVLPRGFHKVRYYGLWRPAEAELRRELQQQLAVPLGIRPLAVREAVDPATAQRVARCFQCGRGTLHWIRPLPRVRVGLTAGVPP